MAKTNINMCLNDDIFDPEPDNALNILKSETLRPLYRLNFVLNSRFICDRICRLFAVWCAEETLKLVKNPGEVHVDLLNLARAVANEEISEDELFERWRDLRDDLYLLENPKNFTTEYDVYIIKNEAINAAKHAINHEVFFEDFAIKSAKCMVDATIIYEKIMGRSVNIDDIILKQIKELIDIINKYRISLCVPYYLPPNNSTKRYK